ncbi:MAG: response regulator transcription factor [Vampirovibrionales bacterium]|nr:response regulator transcription factor [Vampirovibrionales bacterium]
MLNILLIDDEPVLFRDILTTYNYQVDVAEDGYLGLRLLHENARKYDLILLDLRLPYLDGWEILRKIRADHQFKNIFIVMLTAEDAEESIVTGLNRGADLYLTKPISPGKFIAHIKSVERMISRTPKKPDQSGNSGLELLTSRENEILMLVSRGMSNKQIAEQLMICETTVKNHLAKIFNKLKVGNRTEAVYYMQKIISPSNV